MMAVTIEYDNKLTLLNGDGVAEPASPIDAPIYVSVEKLGGFYKICIVYMRTLEQTTELRIRDTHIKYGIISGKILMYNSTMSRNNTPAASLDECVVAINSQEIVQTSRFTQNVKSSVSLIRKIMAVYK